MALARVLTAIILVTVWTEAALQQPPRDGRPPLRSAEQALVEAHDHYKAEEWRDAVQKYEEALAARPDLVSGYFFLANSYDNLYEPRAGDPANDAHMRRAVQHYKTAAERDTNPAVRKLALEYLVAAYGPDKLNAPSEAEPFAMRMVELDPASIHPYFMLARIYEQAGRTGEAEHMLIRARDLRPRDPRVFTALGEFYHRLGDFTRTMNAFRHAADLQPDSPEGHQRVAVFYWEKAFRDERLTPQEKGEYLAAGVAATDRALALDPDYAEALTYKNILLRLQAQNEPDTAMAAQLLAEADALRSRAIVLNRRAATGGRRRP